MIELSLKLSLCLYQRLQEGLFWSGLKSGWGECQWLRRPNVWIIKSYLTSPTTFILCSKHWISSVSLSVTQNDRGTSCNVVCHCHCVLLGHLWRKERRKFLERTSKRGSSGLLRGCSDFQETFHFSFFFDIWLITNFSNAYEMQNDHF